MKSFCAMANTEHVVILANDMVKIFHIVFLLLALHCLLYKHSFQEDSVIVFST